MRFRADRRTPHAVAGMMLICAAGACAHFGASGAAAPLGAELSGTWIDGATTLGPDTTLWRLTADGHRQIVDVRDGRSRTRALDRWYVTPALSDSATGRLCFVQRPGRDGPSCSDYQLVRGTARAGGRRVRLLAPWTRAGNTPRILVELPAIP